jgi:hypothetical protein
VEKINGVLILITADTPEDLASVALLRAYICNPGTEEEDIAVFPIAATADVKKRVDYVKMDKK